MWTARSREATPLWSLETTPPISRPWTQEKRTSPVAAEAGASAATGEPDRLGGDFSRSDRLCPSRRGCCRRHRLCSVSSDSDHLVIDENPAPRGLASTPTDTTTTDTPDSDSSRVPHEDSRRPLTGSGSRSPDSGVPCTSNVPQETAKVLPLASGPLSSIVRQLHV
ncbi:hypothetical protein HPB47_016025 [Ixodes persulcatus]|uniref:Uncharacterized protein n=1 Tax=Ixodes persulcatus TaxID=34615 RepID=A0AC60QRX8_IXOPE|nr:hypothetical protein HPB47_016025 [Ixodes persulcatus]